MNKPTKKELYKTVKELYKTVAILENHIRTQRRINEEILNNFNIEVLTKKTESPYHFGHYIICKRYKLGDKDFFSQELIEDEYLYLYE